MICHKQKYIFIHNQRTGGNSIKTVLRGSRENYKLDHRPISYYLKENAYEDYLKFTWVRNPYNRLYSWVKAYNGYKKYWENGKFPTDKEVNKFISTFLETGGTLSRTQFSQCGEKMNFVGRFENLQNDFNKVCDYIGIKRETLPHKYKSHLNKPSYEYLIEPDLKRQIYKKHQKDFEYYGY